jgi:hypothetical protein
MNVSEIKEKLLSLGFRLTQRPSGEFLCVNPRSGVSVLLPSNDDDSIEHARLQKLLETLSVSWVELESA